MDSVIDFIHVNRDRYVDELKNYLAIPSISALPDHKDDVRKCAEWTAEAMRRIGLQNVRLEETPGHPAVYGEWLDAPGAPTILFYGHYDVQPVDPVGLWTSPPFEPTERDGRVYARGSADDKGQLYMHVKALEAWLATSGELPVNVIVLAEGEEEVGSKNLLTFFDKYRASPAFAKSKTTYTPGSTTHSRVADPKFVKADADPAIENDYRLQEGSPAADAGVALPADWPDPLRQVDKGKPDIGALPLGAPPLTAGRRADQSPPR